MHLNVIMFMLSYLAENTAHWTFFKSYFKLSWWPINIKAVRCSTSTKGRDPEIWVCDLAHPWKKLCNSNPCTSKQITPDLVQHRHPTSSASEAAAVSARGI